MEKIVRSAIYGFAVIAVAISLAGCQTPRFITAKIKTMNVDSIGNFDHLKNLMTNEDPTAAEAPQAEDLRQGTQEFYAQKEKDLEIYGDRNGSYTVYMLAVSQPQTDSTFPLPVEMAIYTTSAHQTGQSTNSGYAEIRFGANGPVYTTNTAGTFFQFEISSIYNDKGDDVASGKFSFIARNKDDLNDKTRLIVMDGVFITRIK